MSAAPVGANQRFTRHHPCPICGGHDGLARDKGTRCYGFLSDDAHYAHCTREELAGSLLIHPDAGTYAHRLSGQCACGASHGGVESRKPLPTRLGESRRYSAEDFRDATAVYDYRDEAGQELFRIARFGHGKTKTFRAHVPNGDGTWSGGLSGARRVLYRLPELLAGIKRGDTIHVVEGEKKCEQLRGLRLTATTNPFGAGKWRQEHTESLTGALRVVVWADNDSPGRAHAQAVANALSGSGVNEIRIVLPPVEEGKGLDDWLGLAGRSTEDIEQLVGSFPVVPSSKSNDVRQTTPWDVALDVHAFVEVEEVECEWLVPRLLARGVVTAWFSPRGIGKTLIAHHLAIRLAERGRRVLLIDRDNPRREVTRRLKQWGLDGIGRDKLCVIPRDQAPPLTQREKWRQFPVGDYDLVVLDALDSATEGVGESDSGKPSQAIAALLDVVRSKNGPAFLVLGNTIKGGQHGRGSGVIEDRFDLIYEVRDATSFVPTGKQAWWKDLPASGRDAWGDRAARRKRRDSYRLAFVPTKFRVGEEPEPFAFEVSCGQQQPWKCSDITDQLHEGEENARASTMQSKIDRLDSARAALRGLVDASAEPVNERANAEPFLMERGLSRDEARDLIFEGHGLDWQIQGRGTKGQPRVLVPLDTGTESSPAGMIHQERPHESRSTAAPILATVDSCRPPETSSETTAVGAGKSANTFRPGEDSRTRPQESEVAS